MTDNSRTDAMLIKNVVSMIGERDVQKAVETKSVNSSTDTTNVSTSDSKINKSIDSPNINSIQNTDIPKTPKNLTTRCNLPDCNKKFGVIPFECKCGLKFCALHRHSFDHNCTYDYKVNDATSLKKTMIDVKPEKIKKI